MRGSAQLESFLYILMRDYRVTPADLDRAVRIGKRTSMPNAGRRAEARRFAEQLRV